MSDLPYKILLIADNSAEAELLEELLTEINNEGFGLAIAHSLEEGIVSLQAPSHSFKAILLDLNLSGTRGLESLARLRAAAPTMPIVVLTVLNDRNLALAALQQGAQDYLVKGHFEGELLARSLQQAIERQRIAETLRQQAERQRLLGHMVERIRQSLEMREILMTTVQEVQQFLKASRVMLGPCSPQAAEIVVVEASVQDSWESSAVVHVLDFCFCTSSKGEVPDFGFPSQELDPHSSSTLTLPIWQSPLRHYSDVGRAWWAGDEPLSAAPRQLWGMLVVQNRSQPWQQWEIEFLEQLTNQLAIAIQQSALYRELAKANQELQRLATLDGLTGVANRRQFDCTLKKEWRRMLRNRLPLSLILCDIDCFKAYNDTYGHLAGDACLKQVAGVISATARRSSDLVARYGGEEFAVVLPNTDASGAIAVAQAIRQQLKHLQIPNAHSRVQPYITLSFGIATRIPTLEQNISHFIQAADSALYAAKAQGRDRIVQGP